MNSNISKLIGITEQQFDILKSIDIANVDGVPKSSQIEKAYEKLTGKRIQKPNLFGQLRELQNTGLIIKTDLGYDIDTIKIKKNIIEKKKELHEKIDFCKEATKNIDNIFASSEPKASIKLLTNEEQISIAVDNFNNGQSMDRACSVPSILYSPLLQKVIGAHNRSELLFRKCKEEEFKARYLLKLDLKRAFIDAYKSFRDKDKAYEEVEKCFDILKQRLNTSNIEFYFIDEYVDYYILLKDELQKLSLIPLKSNISSQANWIYINDKSIYAAYGDLFEKTIKKATKIKTKKQVDEIAKLRLKELKSEINNIIKNL